MDFSKEKFHWFPGASLAPLMAQNRYKMLIQGFQSALRHKNEQTATLFLSKTCSGLFSKLQISGHIRNFAKNAKMTNIQNVKAHALWVWRSNPASSGHSRTMLKVARDRFSISHIDRNFGPNCINKYPLKDRRNIPSKKCYSQNSK